MMTSDHCFRSSTTTRLALASLFSGLLLGCALPDAGEPAVDEGARRSGSRPGLLPFHVARFDHYPSAEEIEQELNAFVLDLPGASNLNPTPSPGTPVPGQKRVTVIAATADIKDAGTDQPKVWVDVQWRADDRQDYWEHLLLDNPHLDDLNRGTISVFHYFITVSSHVAGATQDRFVQARIRNNSGDGWYCSYIELLDLNSWGVSRRQFLPFDQWVDSPSIPTSGYLPASDSSPLSYASTVALSLDETPTCVTDAGLALAGSAGSRAGEPSQWVSRITISSNGDLTPVCTNCGVGPSFATTIMMESCSNEIVVRADTAAGFAEVKRSVTLDAAAPDLAGCDDITVDADPGLGGAFVSYPVAGLDDCTADPDLVCDVPSGSFFHVGQSMSVTCRAVDQCGHEASCTFVVSVVEPESCESPEPHEQDYWRTHCNHMFSGEPLPDPRWTVPTLQALLDSVAPTLHATCDPGESTCQALAPDPYWESCEQACQHYAALLLNVESGFVAGSCCTTHGTVMEAAAHVAELIASGQCDDAVAIGYEFNRGCLFCEGEHLP